MTFALKSHPILCIYRAGLPLTTTKATTVARGFFCYNSPVASATEVFKPSTDAESLLGSIKKKFFDSGKGFAWGRLAKWGCFRFFDQL